jgi:hypothetical protein
MATTGSTSRLFVRNSTGLVRTASALDATIFNAVISAPIGSTLAWSIFFTLVAFPGADPIGVLVIAGIINIPVLIMFALLGASMPRVGGDYVWVSRVLSPPLALISNLCMIMGGLLGAAYFAKFFSVFAVGPALVAGGSLAHNNTLISWGTNFETNHAWMIGAALFMVVLQTVILAFGTKATFRWQNGSFLIAMAGIIVAFIALAVASRGGFDANFNKLNHSFGGGTVGQVISGASAGHVGPNLGNVSATVPTLFSIQGFMMWNFWSVYMSGELKSASNRRRQLTVMNGALVFDVVLLIIGVALLFHVAGYNFVYAANAAPKAYANVFQLVLGLIVLAGCLAVVIVGAAAIALPLRRPDLYRSSPANVKFLGIPVLFIVAPLSIAEFVALAIVSTQFPALVENGNTANFWWIPAWFGGLIAGGALLYYIPKWIRARQGINVGFVYKELPPE